MATKSAEDVNDILEQAAANIAAVADQAKRAIGEASAAAQQARQGIGEAGQSAWAVAQRAKERADGLAEDMYSRGERAVRIVGRQVEEQPMLALLAAGALGFFLGYLLRGGTR
jgi:ElaB/YqjD/DUF883 family membrane-anchored ribosome-binding protein